MGQRLPRNLVILSLVSLLTDLSTEVGFPLLPTLLVGLGGGALALGFMEGLAESVASFLKYASGRLSDRWGRRKELTIAGYGFSALMKLGYPWTQAASHVVALRTLDRVGKGVRTAPRDALIADSMPQRQWGHAFGIHRAMDTLGAFLGPLLALLLVAAYTLRQIFLIAALPALVGVALLLFLREPERRPRTPTPIALAPRPRGAFDSYLLVVGVFTVGNLSIAFLLLRAHEVGLPLSTALLLYLLYNATYAGFAWPLGALTDRVGRSPLVMAAFAAFILGCLVLVRLDPRSAVGFIAPVVAFGLASAGFEGNGRALAVDLAPEPARGRALGAYHATIGFAGLPGGLLAGWLWGYDYRLAYLAGAMLAAAALAEVFALWVRGLGARPARA